MSIVYLDYINATNPVHRVRGLFGLTLCPVEYVLTQYTMTLLTQTVLIVLILGTGCQGMQSGNITVYSPNRLRASSHLNCTIMSKVVSDSKVDSSITYSPGRYTDESCVCKWTCQQCWYTTGEHTYGSEDYQVSQLRKALFTTCEPVPRIECPSVICSGSGSSSCSDVLDSSNSLQVFICSKKCTVDGNQLKMIPEEGMVAMAVSSLAGSLASGQINQLQYKRKTDELEDCRIFSEVCSCVACGTSAACSCSDIRIQKLVFSGNVLPIDLISYKLRVERDSIRLESGGYSQTSVELSTVEPFVSVCTVIKECTVKLASTSGCFSCHGGAIVSYMCYSPQKLFPRLQCNTLLTEIECEESDMVRSFRLPINSASVTSSCNSSCFDHPVPSITGRLDFVRYTQIGDDSPVHLDENSSTRPLFWNFRVGNPLSWFSGMLSGIWWVRGGSLCNVFFFLTLILFKVEVIALSVLIAIQIEKSQ